MSQRPRVECSKCDNPPHVSRQEAFKAQVSDRASEIDPDQEEDWYSMTLGWAIGSGMPIKEAQEFALHIRYHTRLG
jgi:hypothetical protein